MSLFFLQHLQILELCAMEFRRPGSLCVHIYFNEPLVGRKHTNRKSSKQSALIQCGSSRDDLHPSVTSLFKLSQGQTHGQRHNSATHPCKVCAACLLKNSQGNFQVFAWAGAEEPLADRATLLSLHHLMEVHSGSSPHTVDDIEPENILKHLRHIKLHIFTSPQLWSTNDGAVFTLAAFIFNTLQPVCEHSHMLLFYHTRGQCTNRNCKSMTLK